MVFKRKTMVLEKFQINLWDRGCFILKIVEGFFILFLVELARALQRRYGYRRIDTENRTFSNIIFSLNCDFFIREWAKFTGTHPGQMDDGAETFFTPEIDEVVSFLAFKSMGR